MEVIYIYWDKSMLIKKKKTQKIINKKVGGNLSTHNNITPLLDAMKTSRLLLK